MEMIKAIKEYTPFNEQEKKDKQIIIDFLEKNEDALHRSNLMAHITVSGWVVNRERSKVLMAYHNLYDSWAWLGGHADGEADLLAVAMKEVREESGISNIRPVTEEIFSIEILTVDGHVKRGEYVPSHLHLNFTFLLEGDEEDAVRIKADENSGVAWFDIEEAMKKSSEPWFVENIYSKLINKTTTM